jgi:hypothetical protein
LLAGNYTVWGYEHLYRKLNNTANQQASASLKAAINTDLVALFGADNWPAGIPLSELTNNSISRDTDGGTVVSF